MHYKPGILFIILLGILDICLSAQFPQEIVESIEDLSPELQESQDHEMLIEHFTGLYDNPVNINLADRSALEGTLLFSPFQVFQILRYRQRYGEFYSIYELASIPGFNEQILERIEPFIRFSPLITDQVNPKFKYLIMTDLKTTCPSPSGFISDSLTGIPVYAGSNFRSLTRLKAELDDRILVGITYEKDPGETLLLNHFPQHLSGYMEFRNAGPFKKILAGTYRLQSGLGLVTGTGFNPSPESYNLYSINPLQLKAFSSSSEYNYFCGLAANWKIRNLESIIWFSHNFRDLSLLNLATGTLPGSWESYFRETGLHRTIGEINGSGLAFEESAGIMINRKFSNFIAGGVFVIGRNGLTPRGADSLSIKKSVSDLYPKGSVSLLWFDYKTSLFLEMAFSSLWEKGILGGTRYTFNDFLNATLLFRYYDRDFEGLQPSAYSMGSNLQNETGPVIFLDIHPFRNTSLKFDLDICRIPGFKKDVVTPAWSGRYKLDLKHSCDILTLDLYLSSRYSPEKGFNSTPGISPLNFKTAHHFRLQSSIKLSGQLSWNSRLELSFSQPGEEGRPGSIMYQEISGQSGTNLSFRARYTLFRIDDWDNRIYCYEPGLIYNFNFPVFYGAGSKFVGIIQVRIRKVLRIGIKSAITIYGERDSVGSGYDTIDGNKKLEFWIQVTWKN